MKKQLFFYLLFLPIVTFSQFPAPTSFQISINYILTDQWDYCENEIVFGPNYCNIFSWNTPNMSGVSAILTGYRVYKDDAPFQTLTDTILQVTGIQLGKFYVTALYENPPGESDSSNVVVVDDLPIATKEVRANEKIEISFDLSHRQVIIQGNVQAKSLAIYNLQGVQLLYSENCAGRVSLDGLPAGMYLAVVRDRRGNTWSDLVLVIGD